MEHFPGETDLIMGALAAWVERDPGCRFALTAMINAFNAKGSSLALPLCRACLEYIEIAISNSKGCKIGSDTWRALISTLQTPETQHLVQAWGPDRQIWWIQLRESLQHQPDNEAGRMEAVRTVCSFF